ncbi:hypothetical protein J8I26_07495 [Herbaspirillum sp. LeCh32-8]|uniref:hypothetical protein n=1 Tax=Herbaspirillum sp. LeCh32-8 TaxID=2821356 RepID=UPI001AE736AA|nr:hypothetical protein [Herbaspirillum sp. LeCh32-8]MBP0597939.1 hypothetical protein [Herbaspirillum sp. LeCh32-8]
MVTQTSALSPSHSLLLVRKTASTFVVDAALQRSLGSGSRLLHVRRHRKKSGEHSLTGKPANQLGIYQELICILSNIYRRYLISRGTRFIFNAADITRKQQREMHLQADRNIHC